MDIRDIPNLNKLEDIKLNFSYSKAHIVSAYRLNIFPTSRSRRKLLLFSVSIFGIVFLFILGTHYLGHKPVTENEQFVLKTATVLLLIMASIWSIVLIFIALGYYILPGYVYRNQGVFKGRYTLIINKDKFTYTHHHNEDESDLKKAVNVGWDDYTHFAENKDLIVLYKGKSRTIFPKEAFHSESDLNTFRQLLNSKSNIKQKYPN